MQKILFLSFLFLSCANADTIYRWRDTQGKIHYEDSIPETVHYEQVNNKNLPPVNATTTTQVRAKKSKTSQNIIKKSHARRNSSNVDSARKQCRRYEEQLENIANRLHEGYKEPMGNRLRTRRRQLEQRVHDEC